MPGLHLVPTGYLPSPPLRSCACIDSESINASAPPLNGGLRSAKVHHPPPKEGEHQTRGRVPAASENHPLPSPTCGRGEHQTKEGGCRKAKDSTGQSSNRQNKNPGLSEYPVEMGYTSDRYSTGKSWQPGVIGEHPRPNSRVNGKSIR